MEFTIEIAYSTLLTNILLAVLVILKIRHLYLAIESLNILDLIARR